MMRTIDGIKPFQPGLRGYRPLPPDPGPPPNPRAPITGSRSVDGIMPRVRLALGPMQDNSAATAIPAIPMRLELPPLSESLVLRPSTYPRVRLAKKNILGGIAIAVMVAALVVTRQPFGQAIVMVYGVVAIKKQIASRWTFIASLVALGLTMLALIALGGQSNIPAAVATCTFLLLVVGMVSVALEMRRDSA